MSNTTHDKTAAKTTSSTDGQGSAEAGSSQLNQAMLHRKIQRRAAHRGEVSENKKKDELGRGAMQVNYGDNDLARTLRLGFVNWAQKGERAVHTGIEAVLATNLEERLKPAKPDAKEAVLRYLFGELGGKIVHSLLAVAEAAEFAEVGAMMELASKFHEQAEKAGEEAKNERYMDLINEALNRVRDNAKDFFDKFVRYLTGMDDADAIDLANRIDVSKPIVKAETVATSIVRIIEQGMMAGAGTVNEKLDIAHGVNDKMGAVTKKVEQLESHGK